MALKLYAHLEKPRSREQHFLHQVTELAVLLEDRVRVAAGLEKRPAVALPFNQVVIFVPAGEFRICLSKKVANALGEPVSEEDDVCIMPGKNGQLANEIFWKPLVEGITANVVIHNAFVTVEWFNQRTLDFIGFCSNEGDHVPLSAISDRYSLSSHSGTTIYFNRDPASLDREAVQNLVCDVVGLLQLGYTMRQDTDPKIMGLALKLLSMLADQQSSPPEAAAVRRLLDG